MGAGAESIGAGGEVWDPSAGPAHHYTRADDGATQRTRHVVAQRSALSSLILTLYV